MDKCPQCGYVETVTRNRPVTHEMANYVNPETGKVDGAYNSVEDTITVGPAGKQIKLMRQDLWKPKPIVTPPAEPKK